jgi:hypothetical protein
MEETDNEHSNIERWKAATITVVGLWALAGASLGISIGWLCDSGYEFTSSNESLTSSGEARLHDHETDLAIIGGISSAILGANKLPDSLKEKAKLHLLHRS